MAALAEGARPDRPRVRDFMTPDLASVPATATIGLISMRDILAARSPA